MKIIYGSSTTIIIIFLLLNSYTYLFGKETIASIKDLSFPDFFRVQLAVLKILAIVLLLVPYISIQAEEWKYVGVGLFITAFVAHLKYSNTRMSSILNCYFMRIKYLPSQKLAIKQLIKHTQGFGWNLIIASTQE